MQEFWSITNIIAVNIGFVSIVILFLINRKFADPLFKYSIYLQVSIQSLVLWDLLIEGVRGIISFDMLPAIGLGGHHLIRGIIIYVWMLWGHKIILKNLDVKAKIVIIILQVVIAVNLAINLVNGTQSLVLPLLASSVTTVYVNILVGTNLKNLSYKSARGNFKFLIGMTSALLASIVISQITAVIFPQTADVIRKINFSVVYNIAVNTFILISIAQHVFSPDKKEQPISDVTIRKYGLTNREIQIADLLQSTIPIKKIGDIMCITPQTAKNYASRLYQKMGVSNRLELTRLLEEQTLPEMK